MALTLGLHVFAVYAFGSLLSLVRPENLGALVAFGLPFILEAAVIAAKVMPASHVEGGQIVRMGRSEIENDLSESLLPKEPKEAERSHVK